LFLVIIFSSSQRRPGSLLRARHVAERDANLRGHDEYGEKTTLLVIPAKAGTEGEPERGWLDPRLLGDDEEGAAGLAG